MRTHEEVLSDICNTLNIDYINTLRKYKYNSLERKILKLSDTFGDMDVVNYAKSNYLVHNWRGYPYILYGKLDPHKRDITKVMEILWYATNLLNKRKDYWD